MLREALTTLWEKARGRRLEALAEVTLRVFDATDGFRLMGAVNAVPGAAKSMRIDGGYETTEGGTAELEFKGPIVDAQPVKDFLEPQLRAARHKDVRLVFEMRFADGLALGGSAPEALTERLARYSSGAAYVTATAKPIG